MNPLTSPFVLIPAVGIALAVTVITLMIRARAEGESVKGWHTNLLTASVVAVLCTVALGPMYAYAVVPAEATARETIPLVKVGDSYVGAGLDDNDEKVTYFVEDTDGTVVPKSADSARVRVTESQAALAMVEVRTTVKPASLLWPFDLPADDEYTIIVPTGGMGASR